eukprot:1141340-Pelagomonas_calceolata.AAC.2
MNLTLEHAIWSAVLQTDATATSMFPPSWGGLMSNNLNSKLLIAYPHLCCTLRTIPLKTLNYATTPLLDKQRNHVPRHSWSLQIIAVWNPAARIRLDENNPFGSLT